MISTFVDREDLGERSEIDTDARIAPGNSGGAAVNNDAELIGIPTALFAPDGSPVVSGRIRPINFVSDLIEDAERGQLRWPRRVAAVGLLLQTPRARLRRALLAVAAPYRPRDESPLCGRVVMVTGASSGIGEATARAAAEAGATVLLVARRVDALAELEASIGAAGGRATSYPCDLTDHDALDALVARVLAEHGAVDYLVNNAGRSIRRSLHLSQDRFHDVERTMAVNFFAPVRLTMGLLPAMRAQRFGHVVNIVSWGVQLKAPKFSAYLASKTALDTWGRIAAREAYGDNVTVTNMRFGLVRTAMVAPSDVYAGRRALTPDQAAARVVRVLEDRPVVWGHPMGTVGEVLGLVAPRLADAVLYQVDKRVPDSPPLAASRRRPRARREFLAGADGRRASRLPATSASVGRPGLGRHFADLAGSAVPAQSGNPRLTGVPGPGVTAATQLAFFAAVLRLEVFLAALFFDVDFLAADFFVVDFFAADFFEADFLAGFSSASSSSPRAVLAAFTERCSAASRSTTSPEDLVEVGVRFTSPPSTLAFTRASTAPA